MDVRSATTWFGSLAMVMAVVGGGCLGEPPQLPPPPDTGSTGAGRMDSTGSDEAAAEVDSASAEGQSDDDTTGDSGVMTSVGVTTGIDPGDCCTAHMGLGCSDPQVTDCVCEFEPSCCEGAWTQLCVDLVANLGCGTECGVAEDACCEPHVPCPDAAIQDCVCAAYPSCCDEDWGLLCVAMAASQCGVECRPIEGDCCAPGMQFGCDSYDTVLCTCEAAPECCQMPWDQVCVEISASQCAMC